MDSESSSSEDEAIDAELDQAPQSVVPSTDGPTHSSDIAIAQKRVHMTSSSESEKEGPSLENPSLQVVVAHSPQDGWVEVKKKKGKNLLVETSAHFG